MLLRDGTFKIVYLQARQARIELFAYTTSGRELDRSIKDEDLGFKHIGFQVDGRR